MSAARWPGGAIDWGVIILGVIVTLLGLPLFGGGADLAMLGGSWYYLIVGAVVTVAGILMVMGRSIGAVLYLVALIGTWIWALWETGLDGWGLLPRVFGPTVLGILVLIALPTLRNRDRVRATSPTARGAA